MAVVLPKRIECFRCSKYFTPNGDGIHDNWNIKGLTASNSNAAIYIFDRYGKLLKQINLQVRAGTEPSMVLCYLPMIIGTLQNLKTVEALKAIHFKTIIKAQCTLGFFMIISLHSFFPFRQFEHFLCKSRSVGSIENPATQSSLVFEQQKVITHTTFARRMTAIPHSEERARSIADSLTQRVAPKNKKTTTCAGGFLYQIIKNQILNLFLSVSVKQIFLKRIDFGVTSTYSSF